MPILFQFLLFLPILSQASPVCELSSQEGHHQLICQHLSISSQQYHNGVSTIAVDLHDSLSLQLTIEPSLRGFISQFRYDLGHRELAVLAARDVRHIRRASMWIKAQNLEDKFRLMRFFENLPVGESLHPLSFRGGEVPWPNLNEADREIRYDLICHLIGKNQKAQYKVGKKIYTTTTPVGGVTNDCIGRCGPGCPKSERATYTQQCLNHDVCHRTTGQNLGVCSGEFLVAMTGYILAPNCLTKEL